MPFLSILLLLLCCMVTGHAMLGFLRLQDKIHVCGRIGLYFGVGGGTQALLVFYLSLMGVSLHPGLVFIVAGCLLPVSIYHIIKSLRCKKNITDILPAGFRKKTGYKYVQVLLLLLIVTAVSLVTVRAVILPMHLADDRGQWGIKAKIFYEERSVYADDFIESHRLIYHSKYPPLVPLMMSFVYMSINRVDDALAKIPFPGFYVALLMLFYAAQRRFASRIHSLIFTTVLALQPLFIFDVHGNPASGYADVPLTFYFFGASIALLWWIDKRHKGYLLLAALCITLCIFTKKEGLILWFILISACAAAHLLFRKNVVPRMFPIFLIIPAILILPLFFYSSNFAVRPWEKEFEFSVDTIVIILGNIDRIPSILISIGFALFTPLQNAAFTSLCGLSLYITINRGGFCAWSFFLPVMVLHSLVLIFAVVSYPHYWWGNFIGDMPRLLMPVIPLALYCASESLCFSKQNDNTLF